jgi:hypothetical protein
MVRVWLLLHKKQEPAVHLSSRHPTELACLQELLKRLQDRHVDCAEALTKEAAADAQSAAAVSEDTPSVLEAMMLLQQVKKRAQAAQDRAKAAQDQVKAVKKVALEAEKDNDAAQKEVQELQRVMEPKRTRTNATTANDHEECDEQSSGDMDIADYRRETARIQKRRSVALGSRGSGHGCVSRHKFLDVPGCLRSKLTVWKEEQFMTEIELPLTTCAITSITKLAEPVMARSHVSILFSGPLRPSLRTTPHTGLRRGQCQTLLSSSSAGSTEWRRMRQDSRSKTHHGHLCLC